MKRLYLLRHAKSDWDDATLSDFDRPLNARGRRTAPFMGELMAGRELRPAAIVSSPAKRAAETALLVKESGDFDAALEFDERIYEASLSTLLQVIAGLPARADTVLLVGHNPGMEALVRHLTGELHPMPTAALASIALAADEWQAVDDRAGSLEFVIRPKEEMKKASPEDE